MAKEILIVGGGPSGLMAAEILSANNYKVTIFERKPSFGRKFLMAGRGGLNISHSENIADFIKKYGSASSILAPVIQFFSQKDLKDWCEALGQETFVGSSGRIFPKSFKASPLLRSWLQRLEKQKVIFKPNHDWLGWKENKLVFKNNNENILIKADITILCLGGGSWPKLGSDGSWIKIIENEGIKVLPFKPSNCGFVTEWSDFFSKKFQGKSLKSVVLAFQDKKIRGEFIITKNGIEGGAIYALSSLLRDEIDYKGSAKIVIDLKPDLSTQQMIERLQKPKKKQSISNYLRKTLNLSEVAIGLIMELPDRQNLNKLSSEEIIPLIKSYIIHVNKTFEIDRAISSAGGIDFKELDKNFMLKNKLNVYVAGEMLDWEAPTGGYLLQACLSNGAYVANAIIKNINKS